MSPTKKTKTKKKTTVKKSEEKSKTKPKIEKKTPKKKTITLKKAQVKNKKMSLEEKQKLFSPTIEKITINVGVGEAGERLNKAETVLKGLTGRKSIQTLSRTTNKDWGLRKRMPIGCKVTLRGKDANEFLKEALSTRENKIADYSFDNQGNLSFGVPDHTLFKDQKYDPNIGIFGMDINITMKKPGYRIKKRRIEPKHIPHRHRVTKDQTIKFFQEQFNVEVIE